ncbi:hypothetical protein M569_08048, partial [Genlisea aurea]
KLSTSTISSWARNIRLPQFQPESVTTNAGKFSFSRFASGIGQKLSSPTDNANDGTPSTQSSAIESFAKGIVDSSLNAVKAVQAKARHAVSQNKRRYQEGGFDLDMTYITENIIAMGFPAGDLSSGLFGYFEGFYRNHMEEVIKFFETHHKGKYKVYNLCSERLYDASLFEGKVACFPFDDHNCPPIHLMKLFCQSAYSWLKEDIINVVVVHCKAGKARTGLMICSLLLFLKFFPSAEECIDYYNQKRCVDGKGLILPSQIRYVKYFELILNKFNGDTPPGRRCMLRGFRLHKCPYWVRPSITISNHNGILFSTKKHPKMKNLMPEDFWLRAPKKSAVVFALPGEPGLTELKGDFKIHFQDRQGDFYCWLNTSMMENRVTLDASELDGFHNRKLPSPGFQLEIVMIDYDGVTRSPTPAKIGSENDAKNGPPKGEVDSSAFGSETRAIPRKHEGDDDDVFSDSDGDESASKTATKGDRVVVQTVSSSGQKEQAGGGTSSGEPKLERAPPAVTGDMESTDIKAIAADASVFSFGDDEDYESE